ncbi:GNAT family N-acetyltransferase [Georgenia satyanarayanai]|uniref:GNAT family N-acetyltransferase n=1 Tax=Georgenia satyanarayanai TaxID=860221 RepID=UPI0020402A3B|nr:GNAT family N-acetyltransferase [Georgenia satyanarayanai]MCM3660517.1 GNAT family N-acetyltransferase [Georgenia satyanarayanai]
MRERGSEARAEVREATADALPLLEATVPGNHAQQLANAAAGRRSFLAAWCGEEPVGTVVLRWTGVLVEGHGAVPEIGSLEVVPARRGEGIGSLLVAAAEQRVRERGAAAAAIVVAEDNRDARRLYERLGYRDTGALRSLDGGTGLLLLRVLRG